MLIILEGPDGVGKTTLAGKLHDLILELAPRSSSVTIMRKGPPISHPLDEYLTPLLDYRPNSGAHLILDRWHLGEYVYPRLSGRSTQLDDQVFWYLNQYVRRLGGLLVMCLGDVERVEAVYRLRGSVHPFEQPGLYEKTDLLFTQAANAAALPQVTYDWGDKHVIDLRNIVRTAQVRESYTFALDESVTYVGRLSQQYLLLGDVRHGLDVAAQLETRSDRRPAFMPYRGTSGHWLLSAITGSRELRDRAALANACDVDDVYELWDNLGRPKTVALGKNAYGKALLSGIPCGVVPHPQFGRRFHHREQDSYAAALVAALENQEDHSKWRGSSTASTAQPSTAR